MNAPIECDPSAYGPSDADADPRGPVTKTNRLPYKAACVSKRRRDEEYRTRRKSRGSGPTRWERSPTGDPRDAATTASPCLAARPEDLPTVMRRSKAPPSDEVVPVGGGRRRLKSAPYKAATPLSVFIGSAESGRTERLAGDPSYGTSLCRSSLQPIEDTHPIRRMASPLHRPSGGPPTPVAGQSNMGVQKQKPSSREKKQTRVAYN